MTTTFDGRERAHENKHAHDLEMQFKIKARKAKLLGNWAAEKIGLNADETEKYSQSLVDLVTQKESNFLIKDHLQNDFIAAGLDVPVKEIEEEMARFLVIATDQVNNIG